MTLDADVRAIYGSPLSRPKVAIFVVIVMVVLVFSSAVGINKGFLTQLSPAAFQIFYLSLIGAVIMAAFPIAILWFLDRRETESVWFCLMALLWGALIAAGLSLPLNIAIFADVNAFFNQQPELASVFGANTLQVVGAPLTGPIIEEALKGLGVLLLFWLLPAEFDNVRDGFIYGALVGVGFSLFEAPLYVTFSFLETGNLLLYFHIADHFALFGLAGHALYTGLFGLGLGLVRQTVRSWLHYAAPISGWLLGLSAHFVSNSLGLFTALYFFVLGKPLTDQAPLAVTPAVLVPFFSQWFSHSALQLLGLLPFFVIVVGLLWQSGVWERQVIQQELADEQEPVITATEFEGVRSDRILQTRSIPGVDRKHSAAIIRAQNELAFRKWRLKQTGRPVDTDPLITSWREELSRLRADLPTH